MAKQVEVFALGGHIKWEVRWVKQTDEGWHIVAHECENLTEALAIYTKVVGKRPFVTLRSCNVGFPPPDRYQPYYKQVRNPKWKPRSRKEKKYLDKYVVPMRTLNRKGIFWCPYCREMRRFQTQGGFYIEGVFVEDQKGLYCPIDGTSYRDYHVRKWNPVCEKMYLTQTRRRSARRRSGRSTRKQRR